MTLVRNSTLPLVFFISCGQRLTHYELHYWLLSNTLTMRYVIKYSLVLEFQIHCNTSYIKAQIECTKQWSGNII